jgi:DNA polymerase III epsilon subunit-like protein
VTPEAMAVNKIDLVEHRKNGQDIYDTINAWETFLHKNFGTRKIELCGHNVQFDIGFLRRLYRLSSRESYFDKRFSYRSLDTIGLAFGLKIAGKLPLSKLNLASLWSYYQINVSQEKAHNCLADALVTAEVLNKMIGDINGVGSTI